MLYFHTDLLLHLTNKFLQENYGLLGLITITLWANMNARLACKMHCGNINCIAFTAQCIHCVHCTMYTLHNLYTAHNDTAYCTGVHFTTHVQAYSLAPATWKQPLVSMQQLYTMQIQNLVRESKDQYCDNRSLTRVTKVKGGPKGPKKRDGNGGLRGVLRNEPTVYRIPNVINSITTQLYIFLVF